MIHSQIDYVDAVDLICLRYLNFGAGPAQQMRIHLAAANWKTNIVITLLSWVGRYFHWRLILGHVYIPKGLCHPWPPARYNLMFLLVPKEGKGINPERSKDIGLNMKSRSRRPSRPDGLSKVHRADVTSWTMSGGLNPSRAARGFLSDPETARARAAVFRSYLEYVTYSYSSYMISLGALKRNSNQK